jgi:hypothetical protein
VGHPRAGKRHLIASARNSFFLTGCITACLFTISSEPAMAAVGSWTTAGPYGGSNSTLSV